MFNQHLRNYVGELTAGDDGGTWSLFARGPGCEHHFQYCPDTGATPCHLWLFPSWLLPLFFLSLINITIFSAVKLSPSWSSLPLLAFTFPARVYFWFLLEHPISINLSLWPLCLSVSLSFTFSLFWNRIYILLKPNNPCNSKNCIFMAPYDFIVIYQTSGNSWFKKTWTIT